MTFHNGSPSINIDITGALFTMGIQYSVWDSYSMSHTITQGQRKEGASDVKVD